MCMERNRGAYRFLVGKSEGKNHLGELGIEGRIIVKWIFSKWNGGSGLGHVAYTCKSVMNLWVP